MEHRRLVLLVVFLVIVEMLPAGKSDLGADRTALLGLRKVVSGRTLLWNVSQDSPCLWAGVKCEKNRVSPDERLGGTLPSDLGSCADLRNLYLFGNAFSGEIPASLFGLTKIVRLNLAANNLSGEISTDFNKLTRLKTLYLQENILSGSIPDLTLKLDQFNVSFNLLKGEVPAALRSMPASAFLGNSMGKKTSAVDVAAVKHSEVEIPGEKPIGEVENGNGYSVAAAAAAAMTGNGNAKGDMSNGGAKRLVFFGNAARVFDLEDLLRASAEVLGKGTFGTAYKAILEMGTVVAVRGSRTDEKLLVYDYMPMEACLHYSMVSNSFILLCFLSIQSRNKGAGRTPLNWEIRSGIALGAARGIEYLHSQGPSVSHGNIKSSNILLTKVAGYRAPEVTDPRKVSQKADVYSFGVLILELLTSIVREEWTSEVFDLELLRYQNVEEEMVQLLQLAIDCTAQYR
ncbi:putative inactive receptor kinase RLK902 [Vitis vinifera]|uniref:Putative inactive receptor kinase RLK902 n=1 Tax=Vitis vinifera TaxID=29760 RepID=A0A438EXT8_VITVI|nr:putative inactive receptor kinase RLK902 [Vitis vinifera]